MPSGCSMTPSSILSIIKSNITSSNIEALNTEKDGMPITNHSDT